ncbi:response regulator [Rhizomonospora bruguierae]|uniref:response regulator n=1 Tax=Rhizomonospora bruguierae TaxID=1581705 RepID=UPI0020C07BF9|nr:response regulator [Micromonospora sp. NBRC 107566]
MTGTPGETPLRVLLVEDHEMNRQLIQAIVARGRYPLLRGAHLVEAHDLARARAALHAGRYDVILLDAQLPDGSGLDLLGDLPGAGPRPVVIALTGGVRPQQRAAALAAGCDAFLDKPFVAADLVALVAKLIG